MYSSFSPRLRRGFIGVWFQIALGSAQIGATGAVAWNQWRSGVELREAHAALHAAGYSLDPLAACPPEVPDEGNFGNAEPIRGISADEKDQTPEIEARIKALKALDYTRPTAPDHLGERPPELSPDKPVNWAAWRDYFRDAMQWEVSEEDPNDARAVYRALRKESAEILPPLIKAAKERKTAARIPSQRSRFLASMARNDLYLPSCNDGGLLLKLLRHVLLLHEADGMAGGAESEDLLQLQFALCDLARYDATLVDMLVAVAFEQSCIETAWRLAASGKLSPARLTSYQDYFTRRESLERLFAGVMNMELAYGDYILTQCVKLKFAVSDITAFTKALGEPAGDKASPLESTLMAALFGRVKALSIHDFLRDVRRLQTEGLAAYYQQRQKADSAEAHWYDWLWPHEAISKQWGGSIAVVLPKLTWNKLTWYDQRRKAFIITCALERHRLAGGGVPEKLADLPKELLPEIPADFDGQPLRYRREGKDTWVIWSVGLDLKDDRNGKAPPPPAKGEEKQDPYRESDWQWRLPRW